MKVIGNGTVEARGEKKWLIRVCYTDDEGNTLRPSQTVRGSETKARRALREWIDDINTDTLEAVEGNIGAYLNGLDEEKRRAAIAKFREYIEESDTDKTTFSEYADEWIREREQQGAVTESTIMRNRDYVNRLNRYIGDKPLVSIKPTTIRRAYADMHDDGITSDGVYRCHKTLKQIMKRAMFDEVIPKSPCDHVEMTKPAMAYERKSLSAPEAARLVNVLDTAGDTDSHIIGVRLGLATGMRVSEVLGLTWENVDMKEGRIAVRKQRSGRKGEGRLKTKSSERTIEIDAATVEHLRAWRKHQLSTQVAQWLKDKEHMPVVSSERGGYIDYSDYRRWFTNFCVLNGFGHWTDDDGNSVEPIRWEDGHRIDGNGHDETGRAYSRMNPRQKVTRHYNGLKFHELRHTQATLLIANGTDIKTVQNRLGHAEVSLTLDLYAHAVPENDRKAADLIGRILTETEPAPPKVVSF